MSYIVKQNGEIVDASVQPQISPSSIQTFMNFSSVNNVTYSVAATSYLGKLTGYRKYSDQFYIDFVGLVPTYKTDRLPDVLLQAWMICKWLCVLQFCYFHRML